MTTTPWENVTQLMLGVKEGPQIQPLMLGEWFNTQTHGFFSEFSAKNMGLYGKISLGCVFVFVLLALLKFKHCENVLKVGDNFDLQERERVRLH